MNFHLLEEEYAPLHQPQTSAHRVLFVLSLKRFCMLAFQAVERTAYFVISYILLFGVAHLIPPFDSSDNFTSFQFRRSYYIGVGATSATLLLSFFVFVIPFAMRLRECSASGTFGPANDLRRRWTPTVWTDDVRHACAQIWAALTCGASALLLRGDGSGRPTLDPFHAAVVGAVGRWMWLGLRRQSLQEQKEREDDGDGVWRTNS